MTKRDLLTAALREIGAIDPADALSPEDTTVAEDVCDRMFDDWNAERKAVYASVFNTYALTPALSPHTIGPAGTFAVTQRPVELEAVGLVLTTSAPNMRVGIRIRDKQWYADRIAKSLSSSIPSDVYYEPDWPLGKLFFYPVPNAAYSVELLTRIVIAALAINDTFTMPPGYRSAAVLTLAERCCTPFARPVSTDLAFRASQARASAFGNNVSPPRIATRDSGMPKTNRVGKMNWLTREAV